MIKAGVCIGLAVLAAAYGCSSVAEGEDGWGLGESRESLSADQAGTVGAPAGGPQGAQVFSVSVVTPTGVERSRLAVSAIESLTVGDRASIRLNESTHATVSSMGTVDVGEAASVGSVYGFGSSVRLADGAKVEGFVKASANVTQGKGVTIEHGVLAKPQNDADAYTWLVEYPASPQEGGVAKESATLDLDPGRYTSLTIEPHGSTVLHAGHYYLDDLTVSENGIVELDNHSPIYIWVRGNLSLSGTFMSYNQEFSNILIGYLGTKSPAIQAPVQAMIVAPWASLHLPATEEPHSGAFFAKSVVVEEGAIVLLQPFTPATSGVFQLDGSLNFDFYSSR